MIRIVFFFAAIAAIAAIATWIAEPPGRVDIRWGDYVLETSPGVLAAAVALAGALVLAALYLFRMFWSGPRQIGRMRQTRRERLGYRALTRGLVAVAAGDAKGAHRLARRADMMLSEPPLTLLLTAQAAQLEGDENAARRSFEAMLENRETAFLGLRGLLVQAQRADDMASALELAERAFALRPDTPWVLTALLELQTRAGRWSEALDTVDRALRRGAVDDEAGRQRRAGLLTELARTLRDQGEGSDALRIANRARDADPAFLPAALLAAGLAKEQGRGGAAGRIVAEAWRHCPHPALGRLFVSLHPDSTAADRVKRIEKLVEDTRDHAESRMLLARAALDAKFWGTARRCLEEAAAEAQPTAGVFRLLARLEELESGDGDAVRRRLEQASEASPDAAWLCERCGAASPNWTIACERCGALDSLAWRPPPPVVPVNPDLAAPPPDDLERRPTAAEA